jgi:YD repeat-containing protein
MDTAGDLDTTVRRISYTYTSRGQTLAVTQYDDASPGSGSPTDEVKYTYDDWGNATKIEQDHNGLVGAGGSTDDYEVEYAYDKHAPSNARSMLRRASQEVRYVSTLKQKVAYEYDTTGSVNDSASRLLLQKVGGTGIAGYFYNGEAELARQTLEVPKLLTSIDSNVMANFQTYPNIDRFNRVTTSAWFKSTSGGTEFYNLDLTYDEASNITSTTDYVQGVLSGGTLKHRFDVKYTIDGLNRVTQAQEGNLSGGTIIDEYRDELWTLTQTGNWANNKVDLNGDNAYGGTGELDDTRAHNPINEILTRNTNSAGGDEFTLAYNLRGDLENEGGTGGYKYVWDAFGRLVEVRRQNDTLLAAYRYNGLNQRITWHYDADEDGDTDGSDPVYHFCYDDKWRIVGTWRGADTDPKELFIYHNAGLAGRGGSSYIDSVVLRDRDMNGGGGWTGASDGTLEARHYYAQNWRADVSAIFDNAGDVLEWHKYSAYGIPFLLTPGDHDKNGAVDKDDETLFNANFGASNPLADLNKDGVVNSADQTLFTASFNKTTPGGRWKLSAADVGNRKGYGGKELDGYLPEIVWVCEQVYIISIGTVGSISAVATASRDNGMARSQSHLAVGPGMWWACWIHRLSFPPELDPERWNNTPCKKDREYRDGRWETSDPECNSECGRGSRPNGFVSCDSYTPGGVKKLCCVCTQNMSFPNIFGIQRDVLIDLMSPCTLTHEEVHWNDHPCDEDRDAAECLAYTAHLQCLERSQSACLRTFYPDNPRRNRDMQTACRRAFKQEIERITKKKTKHCNPVTRPGQQRPTGPFG